MRYNEQHKISNGQLVSHKKYTDPISFHLPNGTYVHPISPASPIMRASEKMVCIEGDVLITTRHITSFGQCVEGICQVAKDPQETETILFPPEIFIHDHHVQLKLLDGRNLPVTETV